MIPPNALKVRFQSYQGSPTIYYVWHDKYYWYWSALGNEGRADTIEAAMSQARIWIKDGLAGRQRVL